MNKLKRTSLTIFCFLMVSHQYIYSSNLKALNQKEMLKAFVNKTVTSIPVDNLNGKDIQNVFSFRMDNKGNITGHMSIKPQGEPQSDKGSYCIEKDGTFHITWDHWDRHQELCGHIFDTKNAFISVDCDNIFHTVFMKQSIKL